MKLTIERSSFGEAVATASRTVPQRPPMPVMAGIKMTATDGVLTLAAWDYDNSTEHRAEANVTEPGQVLVPGRLLTDIAKQLPAQAVTLTSDGVRAVIACGASRYTLHTLPLEEYPQLPSVPPQSGTVDAAEFAAAVAQVAPAASREIEFLAGVRIEADEDHLVLAATDRYRVVVRRLPWKCPSAFDATVTVRASDLHSLSKSFAGAGTLTLHMPADGSGDGLLGIATSSGTITTRLLDGTRFPKWKTIMPTTERATTLVRAERAALMEAIGRVSLVLDRGKQVFLRCTSGGIDLSGGDSDDAQAHDHTNAVVEGEDTYIAFNPAFLTSALQATTTPEVSLAFQGPMRPALVFPADGSTDPDLRYVVMPVRTNETTPDNAPQPKRS
ncbi:DNA polymerase III subunit beta [Streptomyces xiamenensis]|uniref:DNA polymerase III subunit beta n=1 Tax=Streptomyces xiamenensis TaxID=408015 RepID=UPI0035D53E54